MTMCTYVDLEDGRGKTNDLESVGNNADSHQLLAVVAAVHHQGVGQALNDGAVSLAEALDGEAAGGVRDVDRRADLDVVPVSRVSMVDSGPWMPFLAMRISFDVVGHKRRFP